jgi:hypothetical protein
MVPTTPMVPTRCKLKSNVLVSKRTAISTGFGCNANGVGSLYPFSGGEHKRVTARLVHKAVEFDRFKNGIVQLFPKTNEFDGAPVPQPILNDVYRFIRIFVPGNVGKGDKIFLLFAGNGNNAPFDVDGSVFHPLPPQ